MSLGFLMYGVTWLAVLAWASLVNPHLGIRSVDDLDNSRVILHLVAEQPLILVFPSFDFLLGALMICIPIFFSHITPNGLLNDLQRQVGVFAGVFFIYGAYSRITTFLKLAQSTPATNELNYFGYDLVSYLQYGNSFAVQGFLSAWFIAFHLLQQKNGKGNQAVNLLGMLAGCLGLMAFLVQPLAAVIILANIGCSFYWFVQYSKEAKEPSQSEVNTFTP